LPPTGTTDDETWKQLMTASGNAAPLVTYAITDADIAGPFTQAIPSTLPEQAALDALNFQSPLEALAERFHASPALLTALNPGATFQHAGEQVMVPNVDASSSPAGQPTPAASAITIYVTKSTSSLTIEDAAGHVVFHAPVTSGSEHD